jgi:hypothetical protein
MLTLSCPTSSAAGFGLVSTSSIGSAEPGDSVPCGIPVTVNASAPLPVVGSGGGGRSVSWSGRTCSWTTAEALVPPLAPVISTACAPPAAVRSALNRAVVAVEASPAASDSTGRAKLTVMPPGSVLVDSVTLPWKPPRPVITTCTSAPVPPVSEIMAGLALRLKRAAGCGFVPVTSRTPTTAASATRVRVSVGHAARREIPGTRSRSRTVWRRAGNPEAAGSPSVEAICC